MTTAETSRHAGTAAWTLCALAVAVAAGRLALAVADPASSDATSAPQVPGGGVPVAAFEMVALTVIAVVGAVVASRQPRNPIGWIFGVIALFLGLLILFSHVYWSVALGQAEPSEGATVIAWIATWIWIPPMLLAMTLLPLYFPTGRPPTPRWRWVEWLVAAAGPSLFVGTAFVPGEFADYAVDNPFAPGGLLGDVLFTTGWVGFASMMAAGLGAAASLVVRFRRSVDVERQQIKWVVSAVVLFVVIFVMPTEDVAGNDVGFASLLLGLMIIAIAVAVSILRYRLYDIDVVINKAVVFVVARRLHHGGLRRCRGRPRSPPAGRARATSDWRSLPPPWSPWPSSLCACGFSTGPTGWCTAGVRRPYETLAAMTGKIGDSADLRFRSAARLRTLLADGTGAAQAVVWVAHEGLLVPRATAGDRPDVPEPLTLNGNEAPELDGVLVQPVRHEGQLVGALSLAKRPGEGVSSADRRLVGGAGRPGRAAAGQHAAAFTSGRSTGRAADVPPANARRAGPGPTRAGARPPRRCAAGAGGAQGQAGPGPHDRDPRGRAGDG